MLTIDVKGKTTVYNDIDDAFFIALFEKIRPHTITGIYGAEPAWSLYKSIEHIVTHNIAGDIVECGVWNGGSILLAAEALLHFGDTSRQLYLYDTFAGMPRPDDIDKTWDGVPALPDWERSAANGQIMGFGGTVDMVRDVLRQSAYPQDQFIFVPGLVEQTIPEICPRQISLLRLDTDFYRSTRHELVHLYPRLTTGGILIIDDYGYLQGARIATDDYIREHNLPIFLARVDQSVRLAIKP
jgi:hypothetical protein